MIGMAKDAHEFGPPQPPKESHTSLTDKVEPEKPDLTEAASVTSYDYYGMPSFAGFATTVSPSRFLSEDPGDCTRHAAQTDIELSDPNASDSKYKLRSGTTPSSYFY